MANKIKGFFQEVKEELNKVVWPSRAELLGSTMVVIVTTFILAAFIGAVDFCLSFFLRILVG
ncbi:MAG TPA: preprotein translocase subunit SecE [Candidatus Omnitrophota bacterium]|nr:preprotein translocase subunit SecE [Candidatus Omnitrophota bacterium]